MDPLNIHHVIRHPLSRIETNNLQDKSGCSINGFRSFLFEQGIAQDTDGMEEIINRYKTIRDYRGYPIQLWLYGFKKYPLSDEILKMKNVRFIFPYQSRPIHKLVSPEPHYVEEERDLIVNHFEYLREGGEYKSDEIEDWDCIEMNYEGHLVSLKTNWFPNIQLTNILIERLSIFPHLRDLFMDVEFVDTVTNFSHL